MATFLEMELQDIALQHEVPDYERQRFRRLQAKQRLREHAIDVLGELEANRFVARVRQRYEQHRRRLIDNLEQELAVRRDIYVYSTDDDSENGLDDLDWQVGLVLYEAEDWTEEDRA